MHAGGARTALFNWLFARTADGSFVLRIEDTDRVRSKGVYEQALIEDLKWLGLFWDEGPDRGGPKGPYRQSERTAIYFDYSQKLLSKGLSYRCYCTPERLEELTRKQLEAGMPPRYDGKCRNLKEAPEGIKYVIRFEVPDETVEFIDLVHGPMSIDLRKAGGDFIIMGSDASPLYNFSVVVDDGLMGITHVIRGEDHLPNTPRQILLFKALELKVPEYVHLPLVLAPDRTPLGKRHSSASLRALREEYLPEAVLNTVARLGWSPNRGVLSLEDMVKVFTTLRLSKSPSVFDMDRLKRFNKVTLAAMAADRLAELVSPYLEGTDRGWLKAAIDRVKGDCATVKEIPVLLTPLIEYRLTNEAKGVLSEPYAAEIVKALGEEVEKVERVDCESYRAIIDRLKQRTGEKGKRLLMPVRAALTGTTTGIELEKVFILLGKKGISERLSTYFK
jgi:glutamyl-tRNA synthetase/nondiscriminating glutamyl-tRNA synthetase